MQEDFVKQYLDPSEISPRSRTAFLNNGHDTAAGTVKGSASDSKVFYRAPAAGAPAPGGAMAGSGVDHSDAAILNRIADLLQQLVNKPNGGAPGRSPLAGENSGATYRARNQ